MPEHACPVSTADGTRPVREHAPDGLEPTLPDVCRRWSANRPGKRDGMHPLRGLPPRRGESR